MSDYMAGGSRVPVEGPKSTPAAPQAQRRIEFTPLASRVENRRTSKRLLILGRLQQGPATTLELMQLGGAGFSSRIAELRRAGHRIICEEKEDFAWYTLEGAK